MKVTEEIYREMAAPEIKEKNDFMDIEIVRRKENSQTETNENGRKRTIADENKRLRTITDGRKIGRDRKRPKTTNCGRYANDYERLRTITNDYERLILDKKKILLYLLDHQRISRKEATSLIEAKNTKTYKILSELLEKDQLIDKKGKGRATYYTLKVHKN